MKTAVYDKLYEYIYTNILSYTYRAVYKSDVTRKAHNIYIYVCKRTRVPSHEQSRATIAIIIAKPDDKLNPSDPCVIIYVCTVAVACTRYPRVLYFAGAVMCSAVACRRSPLRFVFFFGGEETFLLLLLFCTVPATDRSTTVRKGLRPLSHTATTTTLHIVTLTVGIPRDIAASANARVRISLCLFEEPAKEQYTRSPLHIPPLPVRGRSLHRRPSRYARRREIVLLKSVPVTRTLVDDIRGPSHK